MRKRTPPKTYPSSTARIGAQGRVVLPAEVREAADLKQGDRLIVVVDDKGVHLLTPLQAVRSAQAIARKYIKPGKDLVAELIRERREEAERE